MEEQLQAEPHEATRRRISARAPTDDDADGVEDEDEDDLLGLIGD